MSKVLPLMGVGVLVGCCFTDKIVRERQAIFVEKLTA
jgi:hypothetical protein